MAKIKVLTFITGLQLGGAENMLAKTLEFIDFNKFDIIVVSLVGGSLVERIQKKCPVIVLNMGGVWCLPLSILKLHKLIKNFKAEIVHSYLFHANIVARFAAIGTRAKVISSIRIKEIKKPSHNIVDAWTSWLVDKYTAVSDSVRNFVIKKEGISPDKILTIPNGLDVDSFKVAVNSKQKRKELNLRPNSKIILSVANLRKTKDYPTLFKAFKTVSEKIDGELLVVGKGEAEEEYKKIASDFKLNDVHFLGFRSDVKELLVFSDVCVLSTFYEGQSNALLEYMAAKRPIVATDIEENREVIDNGRDGILVPQERPDLFAQAIINVLTDSVLRKKLVDSAYQKVLENHDIRRVAAQTEDLYAEILGSH